MTKFETDPQKILAASAAVVHDAQPVGVTGKVRLPALTLTVLGVVLTGAGFALGDEHVYTVGLALLGGGPFAGVVGYLRKLGPVLVPERGPASDALLAEQLREDTSS